MLLDARGDSDFAVHLTYPIEEIDLARKANWEKKQAEEKARKIKNPNAVVREDWSAERHGIGRFMAVNKTFAKRIVIVAEDKP
jgi:hypothetical protein